MKHRTFMLISLCLALIVIFPASAQDDLPPIEGAAANLYQMLLLVPDNDNAKRWLGFSDFRAADQLRPESAGLTLDAIGSSSRFELWARNVPLAGLAELTFVGTRLDETYTLTGVDFFAVDQAAQWGMPPEQGTLLRGQFDQAVIDAALTATGFVNEDILGYGAWCNPEGCDQGAMMSLVDANPANFFGGRIGRKQPIVLADDLLFSSSHLPVVEAMAQRLSDNGADSLAHNEAYHAALAAISAFSEARADAATRPLVRQAVFVNPIDVTAGLPPDLDPDALLAAAEPIPLYELLILVDMGTADSQIAAAVLVFSDAESAAEGAAAVVERLNLPSVVTDTPYLEGLAERGAALGDLFTFDADGKTVLIVPFDYAAVSGMENASFAIFQFIYNGLLRSDLLWLAPL
jgi:hypothetical protein